MNPNKTLKIVIKSQERAKKKGTKNYKNKKTINEMAISISTYLSRIILSIKRLHAPIKRHRVAEWITKQDSYIHAAYERLISTLKTHRQV